MPDEVSAQSTSQSQRIGRVEVGAYYTNGDELFEITRTSVLGIFYTRNAATGEEGFIGINPLRRKFWLVKGPEDS